MGVYTLGIDIGTSSVKAGLLEPDSGCMEYISQRSYDSAALQNTGVIWDKTLEVLKDLGAIISEGKRIAAFGLSGQMHGTVMYDKLGRVIEPLINWQDKSCNQPLAKYGGKTTIDVIYELLKDTQLDELGVDRIASGFLGATLFYIKENDPFLFNRIRYASLPTDFIRGKLLGKTPRSTDPTNAASTGIFDIRRMFWHSEVIKRLGLPCSHLPQIHVSIGAAGFLDRRVLDSTGLQGNIGIIYGGGDLQMSVLGGGITGAGSPDLLNIGTGAQIVRVTDVFEKLPGIDTWPYFFRNYLHVGASLGGGASYHWLRDYLRSELDIHLNYQQMDELALSVPPGAYGLKFCTGPTRQDPRRKSGFYGDLTRSQDVGCMARAVMEGVLTDLYDYYQQLGASKHDVMVGAGNGLGNSRVWSQIAADMFGKKMLVVNTENAVYGAALFAASRLDRFRDLESAAGKIDYSTFEPDRENAAVYRDNSQNDMGKQT